METDKTSRYAKVPVLVVRDAAGQDLELRQLRVIPDRPAVFSITPTETDRLDLVAYRFYRDPLLFWKICDASDALDPLDVLTPGVPAAIPPNK
jgi:hypothetical protein